MESYWNLFNLWFPALNTRLPCVPARARSMATLMVSVVSESVTGRWEVCVDEHSDQELPRWVRGISSALSAPTSICPTAVEDSHGISGWSVGTTSCAISCMIHYTFIPTSEILPPLRGTLSAVLGVESWKKREKSRVTTHISPMDKMCRPGRHSEFTELRTTVGTSTSQSRASFPPLHTCYWFFPLKST